MVTIAGFLLILAVFKVTVELLVGWSGGISLEGANDVDAIVADVDGADGSAICLLTSTLPDSFIRGTFAKDFI